MTMSGYMSLSDRVYSKHPHINCITPSFWLRLSFAVSRVSMVLWCRI